MSITDVFKSDQRHVRASLRTFDLPQEDHDEVVQEAFLRLLSAGATIAPGQIRAFLAVTARNLMIDRYRRRRFRKTSPVADLTLVEPAPAEDRAVAAARALIDEAATFPAGQAFHWHYREGWSLKEIAERTAAPIGTVAARISRAKANAVNALRLELCPSS